METKKCSKCGEDKPTHLFRMRYGRPQNPCKDCANQRQRTSRHRANNAASAARLRDPVVRRFGTAVSNAVRDGKIPPSRTLECDASDGYCAGAVQYHHDSYEAGNELSVRPLCRRHHMEWHRDNEPARSVDNYGNAR